MEIDGIEPSASALSVLATGTGVNGWVLTGTRPGEEERQRRALTGLARAMDALWTRGKGTTQKGVRWYTGISAWHITGMPQLEMTAVGARAGVR